MSLKNVSEKDLEAELARRKKAKEAGERPKLVKSPDLSKLIACGEAHIASLETEGFVDDDSAHYIYEAAMIALYGPDIFKWINKKTG